MVYQMRLFPFCAWLNILASKFVSSVGNTGFDVVKQGFAIKLKFNLSKF